MSLACQPECHTVYMTHVIYFTCSRRCTCRVSWTAALRSNFGLGALESSGISFAGALEAPRHNSSGMANAATGACSGDRDVVLHAVRCKGLALEFAPEELSRLCVSLRICRAEKVDFELTLLHLQPLPTTTTHTILRPPIHHSFLAIPDSYIF